MEIIDNTAAPNDAASTMAAQVFADTQSTAANEYTIAPEDQALADEISKFTLDDIPTAVVMKGAVNLPKRIVADALPPKYRDQIKAELVGAHPDQRDGIEDRLVLAALTELRRDNLTFLGSNTPDLYQRERISLAGELRRLDEELERNTAKLSEVARTPNMTMPDAPSLTPLPACRNSNTPTATPAMNGWSWKCGPVISSPTLLPLMVAKVSFV